ncbi:AI-2E family transporter [Extibacter muris]|uniref:AI-2E family transporter n=1 Tax=Extibacter muris TaxID=1796622 RepID=UPI001D081CE8|nr:AI-2E family transporter [Extibacter muris]MCB6203244.1 AI-2E family transporter [Extibacter muris]MCQ4664840.1 AI-2E family transporter [Extibacter muris]MCQ4694849.1 AI-2E family transporter [Extibacter muris]
MEFDRESVKKIRGLIIFTAIVVLCLWEYNKVFDILGFVFHIMFPFILGGAIAFVLNVPMNFVERHLFGSEKARKSRACAKAARPVSMLIVLLLVFGVIAVVMFILIPQLGRTFANLGDSIQAFIPRVQVWANDLFHNNKEVMAWVNNLKFDWNKIMDAGIDFFRNGAGSVLDSTITAAKSIVSGITTFFIAFVFACYVLLQKEKLSVQAKKVLFAFVRRGRAEAALEVFSLTYSTFSSFLTGQCVEAIILGSMFVVSMGLFRLPYALLVGIVIAFTALIPIFGAFIGCAVGAFLIFMVDPVKALVFVVLFLVLQQIEGNLIYPHVVGNSVGLPSIWVLAAVSIGGSLMGIVGMLIFIPIVSVVYALFREIVYLKLRQKKVDPGSIK